MNNVLGRSLLLASALVASLALSVTAAAAPVTTSFTLTESYVDTDTCPGIPIQTELTGRVMIRELSATRVQVHQHLVYRGTANGKSFTDNESFTVFANPQTGVEKFAGTVVNIQIPGQGNVLLDAGALIADFTTSPPTVYREAGQHPLFLEGYQRLCEYLAA